MIESIFHLSIVSLTWFYDFKISAFDSIDKSSFERGVAFVVEFNPLATSLSIQKLAIVDFSIEVVEEPFVMFFVYYRSSVVDTVFVLLDQRKLNVIVS